MGFLDFLFGGTEDATITQVQPNVQQPPNSNELNSAAWARLMSARPWLYGPYRAVDYARSVPSTPNMVPQMHQMMGQQGGMGGGYQQGGGMGAGQQQMGGMQSMPFGGGMGGTGFPMGGTPPQTGMLGDWAMPNQAMMQPQYSPIAWAMQLGQLFNQLGPMYGQMMGMNQQQPMQQQQMAPMQQQQQPQQQSQQKQPQGGNK